MMAGRSNRIEIEGEDSPLAEEIALHRRWIAHHGGTPAGYVSWYGRENGRAFYLFDMTQLMWLLNAAEGRHTNWRKLYKLVVRALAELEAEAGTNSSSPFF
jgi:hypothetical protein